jgi:hypothetical protein
MEFILIFAFLMALGQCGDDVDGNLKVELSQECIDKCRDYFKDHDDPELRDKNVKMCLDASWVKGMGCND